MDHSAPITNLAVLAWQVIKSGHSISGEILLALTTLSIAISLLILLQRQNPKGRGMLWGLIGLVVLMAGLSIGLRQGWFQSTHWDPLLTRISFVANLLTSLTLIPWMLYKYTQLITTSSAQQLVSLKAQLEQEMERRKKKEAALIKSEQKFQLAMYNAPIAKALVGLDGSWLEVNRATCKMLGYSREELLQTDFQSLTHPDSLDADLLKVQELLAGEIDTYRMEKRYIHKNGKPFWGLLEVSLVRDQKNEPLYFISQIVNIQKSKEAELRMQSFNRELERQVQERVLELKALNTELQNFVYTVTHDLRQPVKNLMGLLSIFKMDYLEKIDVNGQHIVHLLDKSMHRLDHLITDLLRFSKIKHLDLLKESFDLNPMIDRLVAELSQNYPQQAIRCTVHPLPPVYGDPNTICQVWCNLISNAIKYSSTKPQIEIEIGGKEENAHTFHWIKDKGVGFEKGQDEKLFAIFKRLHSPKEFAGTGVGLAMSREILRRHDGEIWAHSELGQGATFFVKLPIVPAKD